MLLNSFCTCICDASMMRTCINCNYRVLVLKGKNLCKITLKEKYNQRCQNTGSNEKKKIQVLIKCNINRINFDLFSKRRYFHNNIMMPFFKISNFNIKKVTQQPQVLNAESNVIVDWYYMCKNSVESIDHLLLQCSVAYGTYVHFCLPYLGYLGLCRSLCSR